MTSAWRQNVQMAWTMTVVCTWWQYIARHSLSGRLPASVAPIAVKLAIVLKNHISLVDMTTKVSWHVLLGYMCSALPYVENGQALSVRSAIESINTVVCNTGYNLHSTGTISQQLTCLTNLQFSSPENCTRTNPLTLSILAENSFHQSNFIYTLPPWYKQRSSATHLHQSSHFLNPQWRH